MIRGDEAWGLVRKRMGHKRESGHGGKATRGNRGIRVGCRRRRATKRHLVRICHMVSKTLQAEVLKKKKGIKNE